MNDPILGFGRYKGSKVSDLPEDYVLWVACPERRNEKTRDFQAPADVLAACRIRADAITTRVDAQKAVDAMLAGVADATRGTRFVVEWLGDLEGRDMVDAGSLDEALAAIAAAFPLEPEEVPFPGEEPAGPLSRTTPDPEDDRILVWEVLASGHRKVVWHFSGWHWSADEFAHLGQGALPGDDAALYEIAMRDY